jgi:hypothetical protein
VVATPPHLRLIFLALAGEFGTPIALLIYVHYPPCRELFGKTGSMQKSMDQIDLFCFRTGTLELVCSSPPSADPKPGH